MVRGLWQPALIHLISGGKERSCKASFYALLFVTGEYSIKLHTERVATIAA